MAKIMCFDIESTGLKASFGHVLCFGYKYWEDPQTHILRIDRFPPADYSEPIDVHLVRAIHELLTNEADIIVSWYGKEFDRKFLNTRMLMAGCPPLPPLSSEHIDLYYTCRANFLFHSNRLNGPAESLGCPYDKTPVRADTWLKAQRGDEAAMDYVCDHCEKDILILDWLYGQFRPYVRQHPNIWEKGACNVCGSTRAHYRGTTVLKTGGKRQRIVCTDCGAWRTVPLGISA